jgi:hypothetical protein
MLIFLIYKIKTIAVSCSLPFSSDCLFDNCVVTDQIINLLIVIFSNIQGAEDKLGQFLNQGI